MRHNVAKTQHMNARHQLEGLQPMSEGELEIMARQIVRAARTVEEVDRRSREQIRERALMVHPVYGGIR